MTNRAASAEPLTVPSAELVTAVDAVFAIWSNATNKPLKKINAIGKAARIAS
jgi:hypothetical protein